MGKNVQPDCCRIVLGARSCACAWDAVFLCAGRCERAAAAGGEGSVLQRGPNWAPVHDWLTQGTCHGSSAHSCCCTCRVFPGKCRSCSASSPFLVSVRVPGRDYLCLISSLAALHRPSPSQLAPRDIYREGINADLCLTGLRWTFV